MSETADKIKEIEVFLESVPKFSKSGQSAANFDLDRMWRFCDQMGHPQKKIKSIHVGGTNGKGTVCRMLASVCQEAGFKAGLYTSPHLLNVKERFKINATLINDTDFVEFFEKYGEFIQHTQPTYFEITTAIAFWFFAKERVDMAILEVGLGGRLDATNVVEPLLSVITSIGFDHQEILGNSLEEIAFEKAGIIKQKTPVVLGLLSAEAGQVIQSQAGLKQSEVIRVNDLKAEYNHQEIKLSGVQPSITLDGTGWKKIDAQNVAIVYKIAETLSSEYPSLMDHFVKGIESVHKRYSHSAVFEKLSTDRRWFFDGAHNAQSVQMLINHLLSLAPANEWSVVLCFMKDKLNEEISYLWNKFPHIYLYEVEGERAASMETMRRFFPRGKAVNGPNFLKSNQFKSELVIFSGSFYFYSIISTWMGAIASADQKKSFRTIS